MILSLADVTCPIKAVMGMECPTCGTTRAMISLLSLDFKGYLYYNPMAVFLISALALFLIIDKLKHKRIVYFYGVSIVIVNFCYYLSKII